MIQLLVVFLAAAPLKVDEQNSTPATSLISASTNAPTSKASVSGDPDQTPSKTSAGSVAGIVFAVLVFIGLVVGGVVWWFKNKDTQDEEIRVQLTV
jgi:uncharacterized protein HemX